MSAPRDVQPPVRAKELLALLVLVVLCDLTIYRGQGFAGYAALFLASPLLLAWGAFRPRLGPTTWLVGLMSILLAAKLLWCGSPLLVACGFALLAAFAMTLSGQTPHVAETVVFVSTTIAAGYRRLNQYGAMAAGSSLMRASWLNVTMPLAALAVFGAVFILANPDLLASVSEVAEQVARQVREWLLTPVDAIVTDYNVRRMLAGDPAPSVQISVHPISDEGVLLLTPLLDCDDSTIREGVRAMLAQRDDEAQSTVRRRRALGWTAYQMADDWVAGRLRADRQRWTEYQDRRARNEALSRFHSYAYQWY